MYSGFPENGNPVVTALAIGLSCGTACSPLVNLFLATYAMSGSGGVKKGLASFGYFALGKTGVIITLVMLSAVLGRAVIGKASRIIGLDLKLILDLSMILTGIFLLLRWGWLSRSKDTCRGCGGGDRICGEEQHSLPQLPVVLAGAAYALTPCAPLLMILAFASLLPLSQALILGLVFSFASSISPLLLLTAMAGFLSQKMKQQIPQLMRTFQWNVFILFIIAGGFSLWMHLR
ncbi:MAG TPA: hypothetical protein VHY08_00420 [Bacillota bacterium]|nr:hypothetical protein [Bacillota bacterium]